MKLSMWMLVNRLHDFELEVHIRDCSPVNLKSARRAYATDCVYVYQAEENSVCQNGEDTIIIKDMDAQEAVEIVQSVFDYYNDWDTMIRDAAIRRDFQTVIDKSWHILHNPVVLLDASWNVLAISKHYRYSKLDPEWTHLCQFGSTSLSAFQNLRNDPTNNYNIEGAQYYHMRNEGLSNCLSSLILSNDVVCGRINIIEYDREFNRGDEQILNYMVSLLAPHMNYFPQEKETGCISVFQKLLTGQRVDWNQLRNYMRYMKWEQEKEQYELIAFCPKDDGKNHEDTHLLRNKLSRMLPKGDVAVVDQNVVLLIASKDFQESVSDTIYKITTAQDYEIGKSLPFVDIRLCHQFYNQAVFAALGGKRILSAYAFKHSLETSDADGKAEETAQIHSFYDCAIEFIIQNGNRHEAIAACHPDILKLWKMDREQNLDRIHTFRVYLNNERSLLSAAQELYVHRNTLVYRINKIIKELTCDLEDVYTRDYMKLSIRILEMYGEYLED